MAYRYNRGPVTGGIQTDAPQAPEMAACNSAIPILGHPFGVGLNALSPLRKVKQPLFYEPAPDVSLLLFVLFGCLEANINTSVQVLCAENLHRAHPQR